MPLRTCDPSNSSFWTDVAEALVTPNGTSAFLLEGVNSYCNVTDSECFNGKLVLNASAVEMVEPKQMDEHTAEWILGYNVWDAPEMYVVTTKKGRSLTCLHVKLCIHAPAPEPVAEPEPLPEPEPEPEDSVTVLEHALTGLSVGARAEPVEVGVQTDLMAVQHVEVGIQVSSTSEEHVVATFMPTLLQMTKMYDESAAALGSDFAQVGLSRLANGNYYIEIKAPALGYKSDKCLGLSLKPVAIALSGWARKPTPLLNVDIDNAISLAKTWNCVDENQQCDQGIPGRFNASHSERQLFVNWLLQVQGRGDAFACIVNKPVCQSCQRFFQQAIAAGASADPPYSSIKIYTPTGYPDLELHA